jgi:hypothetical protein
MGKLSPIVLALTIIASVGAAAGRNSLRLFAAQQQPPRHSGLAAVLSAEAEGARYAHPTAAQLADGATFQNLPGTDQRRCVRAGVNHDVRSGEFMAGPFDYYSWLWQQQTAKVYWQPRISPRATLHVTATDLDREETAVAWDFSSVASGSNGLFFSTSPRVPRPGRWLLVATAEPNWGCFILEFTGTEAIDWDLVAHLRDGV